MTDRQKLLDSTLMEHWLLPDKQSPFPRVICDHLDKMIEWYFHEYTNARGYLKTLQEVSVQYVMPQQMIDDWLAGDS